MSGSRAVPSPDGAGRAPGGRSTVFGFVVSIAAIVVLFAILRAGATSPPASRPEATEQLGTLAVPGETYDPVRAGESTPSGFRQLLRRDAILPIYDPEFIPDVANEAWDDSTLVIGLAIGGEAKAYPVSFLNRREMVVDSIAGIPVLVTW